MPDQLDYLGMQRSKMEWRAVRGINDEVVVGSWNEQENFPYDQNILKWINVQPCEATALEYGCGPGRNIKRMSKVLKRVDGVDISPSNIANAKQYCAGCGSNLMVCDGQSIPTFEKYDLVFSVICLGHISSYTIRSKILKEMKRACKPGGIIVVQFGFNNKPLRCPRYVSYFVDDYTPEDTNGYADCYVSSDNELRKDFEENLGLTVIDIWHTDMVGDESHDNWIWIACHT